MKSSENAIVSPGFTSALSARPSVGEQQEPGGHAAFAWIRNSGYHRRNASSSSLLRTLVRVCKTRCAPRSVQCICCGLWQLSWKFSPSCTENQNKPFRFNDVIPTSPYETSGRESRSHL